MAAFVALAPLDVVAQRETDTAALQQLSNQFARELQARRTSLYYNLLRSTNPAQQALNRNTDIRLMYIRENGMPAYYATTNLNAAKTVRTWDTWPVGGAIHNLTGVGTAGNELAIWDAGGVLLTHQEFGGRVTQVDAPGATHFHSTHVAGTMIAGGFQAAARGMSYLANLNAYDWDSDTAEMAAAGAAGLQVSNHSYGLVAGWYWNGADWYWFGDMGVSTTEDYGFGFYDSSARDWDVVAYNAPDYLICAAAGNDRDDTGPAPGGFHYHWNGVEWVEAFDVHGTDWQSGGYDTISWTANAKNILTVGAVNDIPTGYSVPGDVVQTPFSSWGPCDDGRIKPDIVANGDGLYGPTNTGNANYITISGTSMATPNASGSINLLVGMFESEFAKSPRSSTVKALVINTADEAGANPGPDYANGWGLLNTRRAADVLAANGGDAMGVFEATLENLETDTYYFTVTSPQDVRLTLAWTDPAGTPPPAALDPATAVLEHDLDLRITHLGTATTTLPWKLNRLAPASAAVRADNTVDNVEQIDVAAAAAGTYVVTVGHKGAIASQDYALVWRGMVASQPEETALGLHSTLDLGAPDFAADRDAPDRSQDRGVFITAVEDFQLSAIAMKIAFPCVQTVGAQLYAASGTTRGALLASGTVVIDHPGYVFHYVPITYQLQACQEYEIAFTFDLPVSWPWWSESSGDPPYITSEPYDVGGAVRVRDGSEAGWAGNYALPHFSLRGISNPTLTYTDLSPSGGAWIPSGDASIKRGIYVKPERTVSLDIVNFAAGYAAFQDVTMKVRVFDGSGLVRGALLAEGYKHFTNSASTAISMRAIPVNIVLNEGEVYDVEVEFPPGTDWDGQSEIGLIPFTSGPIRVLDGEHEGWAGNTYIAHFEFAWTEDAGGAPHDLVKQGDVLPPPFVDSQDVLDYGMYVTSLISQELYSLGWMADVPEGELIGMRVYEASGDTRGALISEGQILSSGSGYRWHDVPVAASLVSGQDYDFEIDITQVDQWNWWLDSSGLPYSPYGVIQVRNSEQGGNAANYALPHMRVHLCNTTATPVLDRPGAVPKFTLAAPYPNPVSGTATIDFSLDRAENVSIHVYDVAGRRVATILDNQGRGAGPGSVSFDAGGMASGVYFLKMQTPTKNVSRKITVLK